MGGTNGDGLHCVNAIPNENSSNLSKQLNIRTGNLLLVDRQTSMAVDLTEQVAAKTALQKAASELAERVLPKLAR